MGYRTNRRADGLTSGRRPRLARARACGVSPAPAVRVTGVETPETRHPTPGVDPGGPDASAYTTRRLTGATVRLDLDPAGDDIDAYGRILRYVVLATGENFNATLVRDGYGTAIRAFPYSRQRESIALEAQVRRARRGLWSQPR